MDQYCDELIELEELIIFLSMINMPTPICISSYGNFRNAGQAVVISSSIKEDILNRSLCESLVYNKNRGRVGMCSEGWHADIKEYIKDKNDIIYNETVDLNFDKFNALDYALVKLNGSISKEFPISDFKLPIGIYYHEYLIKECKKSGVKQEMFCSLE